jgi:hypothetical protein
MRDDALISCYQALLPHLLWEPEPFEVVSAVEAHRQFWRPEKVKTLLLAESHVYTTREELKSKIICPEVLATGCPTSFARFVYCLGYGIGSNYKNLLLPSIADNYGTPQYWRLFKQCADADFPADLNLKEKIFILNQLKERGIWLLDTFPIALYGKDPNKAEVHKKKGKVYTKLLDLAWNLYTEKIIEKVQPTHIIVVGKMIWNRLEKKLPKTCAKSWIYQPNARRVKSYSHGNAPELLQQMLYR